ncbi:uncharacterized protein MONOS_1288 [Monocercomonoides exilis]|uniref:uncharacterized protein n=1 Tax=Monocercomonoides exilis TaxID=2049356 RepID=UPI00355A9652|nr:hypothetical protein MONOS_1288 [Monocercomonoides exilis]|eukprot:MONOS_1288.1-p1 / transcript=MONOS_1288.1 / gene=MONOS_1288 / organism=Monocercomonoides_exilis_PA203 / gene_product=unspecified product / transcript_product=unspecified product / location=Mono_scaffold00022:61833-63549(+) / protein_length=551 / sequence_SO=supercontig / SO=protein_coding / is_pseudo=false
MSFLWLETLTHTFTMYRVSPLFQFKWTDEFLQHLSDDLAANFKALINESKSRIASQLTHVLIGRLPPFDPQYNSGIVIRGTSSSSDREDPFLAILCGGNKEVASVRGSSSFPLLLLRGHKLLSVMFLHWLCITFDCEIVPFRLSPFEIEAVAERILCFSIQEDKPPTPDPINPEHISEALVPKFEYLKRRRFRTPRAFSFVFTLPVMMGIKSPTQCKIDVPSEQIIELSKRHASPTLLSIISQPPHFFASVSYNSSIFSSASSSSQASSASTSSGITPPPTSTHPSGSSRYVAPARDLLQSFAASRRVDEHSALAEDRRGRPDAMSPSFSVSSGDVESFHSESEITIGTLQHAITLKRKRNLMMKKLLFDDLDDLPSFDEDGESESQQNLGQSRRKQEERKEDEDTADSLDAMKDESALLYQKLLAELEKEEEAEIISSGKGEEEREGSYATDSDGSRAKSASRSAFDTSESDEDADITSNSYFEALRKANETPILDEIVKNITGASAIDFNQLQLILVSSPLVTLSSDGRLKFYSTEGIRRTLLCLVELA